MYRSPPAAAPLAIVAWNRNIVALDRVSGRRVWTFEESGSWRRIAITSDRIVAGDGSSIDGRMVCLAYETGARIWDVTTGMNGRIVIDGDLVLRSGNGEIACHSLVDGRRLWHDPFRGMGVGEVGFGFPFNVCDQD